MHFAFHLWIWSSNIWCIKWYRQLIRCKATSQIRKACSFVGPSPSHPPRQKDIPRLLLHYFPSKFGFKINTVGVKIRLVTIQSTTLHHPVITLYLIILISHSPHPLSHFSPQVFQPIHIQTALRLWNVLPLDFRLFSVPPSKLPLTHCHLLQTPLRFTPQAFHSRLKSMAALRLERARVLQHP